MQRIDSHRNNEPGRVATLPVMRWMSAACFLTILSLLTMSIAHAESPGEAEANYKKEKAACLAGNTNEDRATCLREAGAAYADAKRGRLDTENKQYEQNALARCQALKGDDRQYCERRVHGEGTVTGSVGAGGELRELRVQVPVPQSPNDAQGSTGH
ncbi:MAG TPA: hypothetical protein VIF60_06720 [Burkholderiaceae bacterium]